jgi:transcriptional regulator with XRE-family HTH domain
MNGEILRRARLAAGASAPRLAAAMGVAVSRITAIERAEHVTDAVAARFIAGLCKVSQAVHAALSTVCTERPSMSHEPWLVRDESHPQLWRDVAAPN